MRVVVTGASGNIGTALLPRLVSDPEITQVSCIARHVPTAAGPSARCDWHAIDIGAREAQTQLAGVFRGADAVVHLAWSILAPHQRRPQYEVNREGTAHVLAAAARAQVTHLVYLSSVAVYSPGPADALVREDWPRRGIANSVYSQDKVAVEDMLDTVETRGTNLRVARIRPPTVVHPAAVQRLAGMALGPLAPLAHLTGNRLPLVPLPSAARAQLIHGADLADLIARVLLRRAAGPFNAADDTVLGPAAIARVLHGVHLAVPEAAAKAFLFATWQARLLPLDPSWLDLLLTSPMLDSTRARTELDWQPRMDARTALGEPGA